MTSHRNTPDSVLEAPVSKPVVIVEHRGLNRAERRGRVYVNPKRRIAAAGKRNTPFVGKVRDELSA